MHARDFGYNIPKPMIYSSRLNEFDAILEYMWDIIINDLSLLNAYMFKSIWVYNLGSSKH